MKRITIELTGAQVSALIYCVNQAKRFRYEGAEGPTTPKLRRLNTARHAVNKMIEAHGWEPVDVAGYTGFGRKKP